MSNNAHDLSNRLLNALDNSYNVVDMHTVNEIISILEKFNITKELLETTRLGKHVNELRRKTTDPTLARRAKVLVKRWRDLVIPAATSPGQTVLTGSNRSSAERQVRRLGGTPLTSPALSRQVVSPAVPSPRPVSRPAWGGYESDSNDVIVVDDDPPGPPPLLPAPPHTPSKRPPTPELYDDKRAKRDKKPKKRRGHSRAGAGGEADGWAARNGSGTERRRNGCKPEPLDAYAALVHRIPKGAKKVKTTKELLEDIQSRGTRPAPSSQPGSPDVMLIEPDAPLVKVDASPLRNGNVDARVPSPPGSLAPADPPADTSPPAAPPPSPPVPLEEPRVIETCTCGDVSDEECPARARSPLRPLAVHALHHALRPGVNGTRARRLPHRFARRSARSGDLFTSVVPLYNYSDYADDYCVKNLARVPLCDSLPWTEFAPPPPDLPPPPDPPPLRPYPSEQCDTADSEVCKVEADAGDRLKVETKLGKEETGAGASAESAHRSVERTKTELDGRALCEACDAVQAAARYRYSQAAPAPEITRLDSPEELAAALEGPFAPPDPEELGRPPRPARFAEWHESATLGDLIALPYVVID